MSRKIDATLDRLEKTVGLTSDGRDWLVSAADPFHDSDLNLAGYPDLTTAPTVVQLVKKQLQIAVPTTGNGTVTSGNNWDCSICLFPTSDLEAVGAQGTLATGVGNFTQGTSVVVSAGALTVASGPSGSALWPNTSLNQPSATYTGVGFPEFAKGNARVIGMAMEIVNTTANINKQGQVTAWRMPNIATPMPMYTAVATTPSSQISATPLLFRFPPSTIAEAQLLYGSRSWAAEEGAYVVSRLTDTVNPMRQPSTQGRVYSPNDVDGNSTITTFSYALPTQSMSAKLLSNFDLSGVHFTGLSYATTLTVNVRWIIERMPGPRESDLVVLATPSAPYDSVALELYTRCMREMPPGVRLAENPLGEWFKQALSAASEFLPTVGAALNNAIPGAGAIGTSLGGLARNIAGMIPTVPKESKPQAVQSKGSASDLAPVKASNKKKKIKIQKTQSGKLKRV